MSIDKISGRLVKHKHKGADILDITNYIGQPLGVFTTAYPSTPSFGRYDFAGTNGATISGTVYNNGDSAFWDGSAWTRIPAQVMDDELNKLVSKTEFQSINKQVSSGKTVSLMYAGGYVNTGTGITADNINDYKYVLFPVYPGEKYIIYSDRVNELCAYMTSETTQQSRFTLASGRNEITIPVGCNFLAIYVS